MSGQIPKLDPESNELIMVSLIILETKAGWELENMESALLKQISPTCPPIILPGISSMGGCIPPQILLKLH